MVLLGVSLVGLVGGSAPLRAGFENSNAQVRSSETCLHTQCIVFYHDNNGLNLLNWKSVTIKCFSL